MIHKTLRILMLIMLLFVAAPAFAQDQQAGGVVITEATSWWNTPAVVAIVLGFVFMISAGVLAFFSMPPWAVRLLMQNATTAINNAREEAHKTTTPFDDLLVSGGDAALDFAIKLLKQRGYNIVDPSLSTIDNALFGGTAQYAEKDVLPPFEGREATPRG